MNRTTLTCFVVIATIRPACALAGYNDVADSLDAAADELAQMESNLGVNWKIVNDEFFALTGSEPSFEGILLEGVPDYIEEFGADPSYNPLGADEIQSAAEAIRSIPEPSTLSLLILCSFALFGRKAARRNRIPALQSLNPPLFQRS